ncbi:MAG: hypothetical protein QGG48_04510 [Desulfatiglandales bacterium]|jgi:hypothetical protein|nr:hypothetical protein [Desulfatiglandales bacterium]
MKDYELFISSHETLSEGEEIDLTVRDTDTLEHVEVKAVVHRTEGLPDTDRLWIRIDDFGDVRRGEKPWSIKILEHIESPEEEEVATRRPEGPLSKRKGYLLRSMLEEAGRKKITEKILEEKEGKKKP